MVWSISFCSPLEQLSEALAISSEAHRVLKYMGASMKLLPAVLCLSFHRDELSILCPTQCFGEPNSSLSFVYCPNGRRARTIASFCCVIGAASGISGISRCRPQKEGKSCKTERESTGRESVWLQPNKNKGRRFLRHENKCNDIDTQAHTCPVKVFHYSDTNTLFYM